MPLIYGLTTSSDLFYPDIFSIIILIAIIAIVTIIYLFKIGYLSIEIVEEKPPKKKK
jgi:nitric oxide reductase large subunit